MEVFMNILVMGGTEFVSRGVVEHFVNLGYTVDIFTRGIKKTTYAGYRHQYIGDRHHAKSLKQLMHYQYEYIIDISAYTKEDVKLLLDAVDTTKLKRYVFCSSGAVYSPNSGLIKESDERGENSNWRKYGLDKLEAENYLLEAFKTDKLPVTIFRPTYLYGPNNNLYRESYFFDMLSNARPIPLPNSLNKTQFLHIHDLVLFVQSMLENDICIGQTYNVTHDHIYDFNQLIDVFEAVTKMGHHRILVDISVYTTSRKYFPYRDVTYTLSTEKLKAHGLHVPQFDLYKGLEQTYKWYQNSQPKLSDPAMTQVEEIIHKFNLNTQ